MWLIWLGAGGSAAFILSYFLPSTFINEPTVARAIFGSEWLHLFLCLQAAYLIARDESWQMSSSAREWAWPLGVGVVAAVIIQGAVEWKFRVLADETNLVGSSMSLYTDRLYQNVLEGYFYYDQFHPVTTVLDKRPGLYPFLMYLLHCLFGYDAYHGFVVNGIAAALSAMLVFRIGNRMGGHPTGAFAVLTLVGLPIFALGATSSGYEVLNQLLLLATFWQLVRFLELTTPARLQLLLLTGLAAAEVRYESILVLLPIGAAACYRFRILSAGKSIYALAVTPLLTVPLHWQRTVTTALNEGDSEATKIFDLAHWSENVKHLGEYLFDPHFVGYPIAPIISVLAIIGAVILAHKLFRNTDRKPRVVALLTAGALILIVSVQLAYYRGDPRQPAAQRIAIGYSGTLALLAALALSRWAAVPKLGGLSWALAIFLCLDGMSRAAADEQGNQLLIARQYKTSCEFLQTQPRAGTLLIADRPGLFVVHRYGAISGQRLHSETESIIAAMSNKLLTNVLIEQRIYLDESQPPSPAIPTGFSSEPLYEFQNDARYRVRISRLSPGEDAALLE